MSVNFLSDKFFGKILKDMDIKDRKVKNIFTPSISEKIEWINHLENEGIDLDSLDDITIKNVPKTSPVKSLYHKNFKVVVYIRDEYEKHKPYRYHLTACKHIIKDKKLNKRYVATIRRDGLFLTNNIDTGEEGIEERLNPCQTCLAALNWHGFREIYRCLEIIREENNKYGYCMSFTPEEISYYRNRRNKILAGFNLKNFFETNKKQTFIDMPLMNELSAQVNTYSDEWKYISRKYRKGVNYRCEKCGKNLINQKHLLQTHHIDRNKYNNAFYNLIALCEECHKKEHEQK